MRNGKRERKRIRIEREKDNEGGKKERVRVRARLSECQRNRERKRDREIVRARESAREIETTPPPPVHSFTLFRARVFALIAFPWESGIAREGEAAEPPAAASATATGGMRQDGRTAPSQKKTGAQICRVGINPSARGFRSAALRSRSRTTLRAGFGWAAFCA